MNSTNRGGLGRILSMQAQSGSAVGVVTAFVVAAAASAQCGELAFASAGNTAVGAGPRAIAVGDFNRDGKVDLAVTNNISNTISILLGTGSGTFTVAGSLATAAGPLAIVCGDINNDGKLDLAVGHSFASAVMTYLGNGNGTFAAGVSQTIGSSQRGIALDDLNGDGVLDLITANYSSTTITVRRGQIGGAFGAATNYTVGLTPNSVTVRDINMDGKPDVLTTLAGQAGVIVRLGNGDGTLAAPTTISGIGGAGSLLADVNSDGKLDLLVLNQALNQIFIAKGIGNGTFQPHTTLAVANLGSCWFMSAADFTSDGNVDIAVPVNNAGVIRMLKGVGDGTFNAGPALASGDNPVGTAVGDFNNDGKLDVAVTSGSTSAVAVYLNTMTSPPTIGEQPENTTVCVGGFAQFSVSVSGAGLSYQWKKDGEPISTSENASAGTNTLEINNATIASAGHYSCDIISSCGVQSTTSATLVVCIADFNCDGFLDFTDFDMYVDAFESGTASSDVNSDGFLDFTDFDQFVTILDSGC